MYRCLQSFFDLYSLRCFYHPNCIFIVMSSRWEVIHEIKDLADFTVVCWYCRATRLLSEDSNNEKFLQIYQLKGNKVDEETVNTLSC